MTWALNGYWYDPGAPTSIRTGGGVGRKSSRIVSRNHIAPAPRRIPADAARATTVLECIASSSMRQTTSAGTPRRSRPMSRHADGC